MGSWTAKTLKHVGAAVIAVLTVAFGIFAIAGLTYGAHLLLQDPKTHDMFFWMLMSTP